ncbi:MAG TPA: type IV toxin-antitoxin system AbiEi family antitoxin domain-containing protein [Bryobacteraceae bacterium]|nr:type IV toxin-antitoxin system AbiEi family antitoxin domain-containing protein [Bryobacteraceae bacterium]
MPRSRFDELAALAEENEGLVTADQARQAGFTDSVLAKLVQRGRIERTARGVYRVPYLTPGRFAQYREALLWATANRGPENVALSHSTALAIYGISDVNPHLIHLTIPKSARLRRQKPKGVVLHREDLTPADVSSHEGIPLTAIGRTVVDLLGSGARLDLVRQAISGARREGFIRDAEARRLRRKVEAHVASLRAGTLPGGLHA